MPPLKQKSNIVKAKVPPPVPPRGSPNARRGQTHKGGPSGSSASIGSRGTQGKNIKIVVDRYSDGPINQIDEAIKARYGKTKLNNQNLGQTPVFGDRKSPTNVKDWLELNDFDCVEPEVGVKKIGVLKNFQCDVSIGLSPKKPIILQTESLRRENSFKALSQNSPSSVRSMVKTFEKIEKKFEPKVRVTKRVKVMSKDFPKIERIQSFDDECPGNNNVANIKKSLEDKLRSKIGDELPYFKSKVFPMDKPKITSVVRKPSPSRVGNISRENQILKSLKPVERKKKFKDDLITKKELLQEMSGLEILKDNQNGVTLWDSFSLEGEFV